MKKGYDVCVVGGCGHVGLPLSAAFASKGQRVIIYDINQAALKMVKAKKAPFKEKGLQELLQKNVGKTLFLSNKASVVAQAKYVVVIIGTPVDRYLNPELANISRFFGKLMPHFRSGQVLILRSTVFPGTTLNIKKLFKKAHKRVGLAFCPERVAEGNALEEFEVLPQIVSAYDKETQKQAADLFSLIARETIIMKPLEAELAKIFTNSFRYINFAIANQFFRIAQTHGVDFYRIYDAVRHNYPRAKGLAKAGFAAGPCLFKDTMQLAAFSRNTFFLGHAAMLINEGLPDFVVSQLKTVCDLSHKTIGILGMAFKAESDDGRDSLSYKLKKLLEVEAKKVICHDQYIKNKLWRKSAQAVVDSCDIVIIGVPHSAYKKLQTKNKHVVDIWNLFGKGAKL